MKLTISQVLKMLAKANEVELQPRIEVIQNDYWIYFWGYDGDSIIIMNDGTFKGYGWTYEKLMNVFDDKVKYLQKHQTQNAPNPPIL